MASPLPLHIEALGMVGEATTATTDPALEEHIRRLILERTGVSCEWPDPPGDWTLDQLLRETLRTGTLPHVLAVDGLLREPTTREMVLREGIAHEITVDLVKKNMPSYTARVNHYGWSVEGILARNRCEGRNLCVPIGFGFGEFPGLADHPAAKTPATKYYAFGLRDDILTRIFPAARTEAQLQEVLLRKGSLDIHDLVDDIPVRNLDDLRRYLMDVGALGLKVGDAPVIPGSLAASFETPRSLYWSLSTAVGIFWDIPFIVGDPPEWDRTTTFWLSREGRRYLRWWNRIYYEGLVGTDLFSLTDDELAKRQCEGRYAVINDWWWADDARQAARPHGYGYRYFPAFYGQWTDIWDNSALGVECQESPLVFTRRIRNQGELRRIMRWADWHLSEERDLVAFWGMPEWYTGTGSQRRFSWQHASLEDWAVYGIASTRDGASAGLVHTPAVEWDPSRSIRVPLGPLSFFTPASAYPEAPYWVYPRDGRKLARSIDFGTYCRNVAQAARYDEYRLLYRGTPHQEQIWELPESIAYLAKSDARDPAFDTAIREAVTAPSSRFENACESLRRLYLDRGVEKTRRAVIEFLREVYPREIEPNIFVDRRKRTRLPPKRSGRAPR